MEGRTHRPLHDEALCSACSICERRCPAAVFTEQRAEADSVRGVAWRSRTFPLPGRAPAGAGVAVGMGVGGEAAPGVPPCQAACPLHQDVRAYSAHIARGDLARAIAAIRETNPLPSVCGAVCNRPCVRVCVRAGVDAPVSIRALKRFAAERTASRGRGGGGGGGLYPRASGPLDVAIVGAGPAGLAAAHDLAGAGYGVTVYDASEVAGGMLAHGIPRFVMPRDLLEADVEYVRDRGVEIRTGVHVGRDVTLEALCKVNRAVVLAVGARRGSRLGIAGEGGFPGATDHVSFARAAAREPRPRLDGPCVVVGGSSAAFQCARSAVRLGCDPVTVAWWRPAERLPAGSEDVADALEEGVRLECLLRAFDVVAQPDGSADVRFRRVREGDDDAWGHRPLVEAGGEIVALRARTLVAAVGRSVDLSFASDPLGTSPAGFLAVDPRTGMTGRPGLFAAGDVVTGPKTVVEAVAAGRKVAADIRAYLERRVPAPASTPAPAPAPAAVPRRATVALRIDGRAVRAGEGESLLAVARREGFEIPAMCWHARLSPYGACRLCLVEVGKGRRSRIATSCDYPVMEGIEVATSSEAVLLERRRVVRLLLAQAPAAAALRDLARGLGVEVPGLPASAEGDCILCGLCVRVCSEAVGAHAVGFEGRGGSKRIAAPFGAGPSDACISCGACAAVCPVGARRTLGGVIRRLRHEGTGDHPCRYALMGLFSGGLCANAYECDRCETEHAMRDPGGEHPIFMKAGAP